MMILPRDISGLDSNSFIKRLAQWPQHPFKDKESMRLGLEWLLNGASMKAIAEVSGHSEKDAEGIIRKHYLVSNAAVEKIDNRTRAINHLAGQNILSE